MTKQLSFSATEKEITARLRRDLSLAKSGEDAKKFFTRATQNLLSEISAGRINAAYDDIVLDPLAEPAFSLSPALRGNALLSRLWQGSDLPAIIHRMADRAANTLAHLEKHLEKTEAKIHHSDR